jgi:hypothetical protein
VELLRGGIRTEDVDAALSILSSLPSGEAIAHLWSCTDPDVLNRFFAHLEAGHFASYPLEILASVTSLDEEMRNDLLREIGFRKPGSASPAEAARALFLLMDVQVAPGSEDELSELRELLDVGNPKRAEKRAAARELRMAEVIRSSLPSAVRTAIVAAVEAHTAGTAPPAALADSPRVSSELASATIVTFLSAKRIEALHAQAAFEEFSALYRSGDLQIMDATVQCLEELLVLSTWLERLFEARLIDPLDPARLEVLDAVLRQRPPALALAHLLQLLGVSRSAGSVAPWQALLARRMIDAYPVEISAELRLQLAASPAGDLTTRLAPLTEAEAADIVATELDDWLIAFRDAVLDGRWNAVDLLEVLQAAPGSFDPPQGFPLQPAVRASLEQDLAALDELGIFDALLDMLADENARAPRPVLDNLIAHRAAAANVSSVRRLIGADIDMRRAKVAYEVHQAMPPEQRAALSAEWARMTEALPLSAEQVLGAPMEVTTESGRAAFIAQLNDPSIWVAEGEKLTSTLQSMLTLTIAGGLLEDFTNALFAHVVPPATGGMPLARILVADDALWERLSAAWDFETAHLTEAQIEQVFRATWDSSLWKLDAAGSLSPMLIVLMRLFRLGKGTPDLDALVDLQIKATGEDGTKLREALLEHTGYGSSGFFDAPQGERAEAVSRDPTGIENVRTGLRAITTGAQVEAENLIDYLTAGTGTFLDIAADSTSNPSTCCWMGSPCVPEAAPSRR